MSIVANAGDKFMRILNKFRPCKALLEVAEESKEASVELKHSVKELTQTLTLYMERTNPPKSKDEDL